MDVKNINIPDFDQKLDGEDWYVYGAYLKPGYHKLLIYDPQSGKAFCKDFVVNLNKGNPYPEFPSKEQAAVKKVANVWRAWHEDAQEDVFKSVNAESAKTSEFLVNSYIRCPIDGSECVKILIENFDIIKIFQKHCQYRSKNYPEIDMKRVWYHLDIANQNNNLNKA